MNIDIVPVWKQVNPALAAELVGYWTGQGAIADESIARNRAMQAVCVARDGHGAIHGVSTAMLKVLPRLRQPLYYYRQYFSRELRGRRLELPFYRASKRTLQDFAGTGAKPESLGLLLELENPRIASAYPHAHEPGFEATFIGYSPRGLQLRVSYFDGALLLPPVAAAAGHGSSPHPIRRRAEHRS